MAFTKSWFAGCLAMLALGAATGVASEQGDAPATVAIEEIIQLPVGPHGWEISERVRALHDQRVTITGFMVRELNPDPNLLLLNATPLTTYACESLAASDLPPNVVQVVFAPRAGLGVAWTPRKLTIVGRLEIGHREEVDGRVSHVRLFAEQLLSAEDGSPVDIHIPLARRTLGARSRSP